MAAQPLSSSYQAYGDSFQTYLTKSTMRAVIRKHSGVAASHIMKTAAYSAVNPEVFRVLGVGSGDGKPDMDILKAVASSLWSSHDDNKKPVIHACIVEPSSSLITDFKQGVRCRHYHMSWRIWLKCRSNGKRQPSKTSFLALHYPRTNSIIWHISSALCITWIQRNPLETASCSSLMEASCFVCSLLKIPSLQKLRSKVSWKVYPLPISTLGKISLPLPNGITGGMKNCLRFITKLTSQAALTKRHKTGACC